MESNVCVVSEVSRNPPFDSWFGFARSTRYPTHYDDHHNEARVDILTAGLVFSILIVAVSILAILPAYGRKQRLSVFLRAFFSLVIGGVIIVCNFGYEWEVGQADIRAQYKAGSADEIDARIGLHVSLRGINVTLESLPPTSTTHLTKHIDIYYNEHFSWTWAQGRFGFGRTAGRISQDFREKTYEGLPYPILQVAEYFVVDGEGLRMGRYYRTSGYFAHIFMWTAFALWLLTNILSLIQVNHACFTLLLTGLAQLVSVLVWTYNRNPLEVQVPFEAAVPAAPFPDVVLKTVYGRDLYLVAGNAALCCLLSCVIWICNASVPDGVCSFFGIDPMTLYFDDYMEAVPKSSKSPPEDPEELIADTKIANANIVSKSETLLRLRESQSHNLVRTLTRSFKMTSGKPMAKKRPEQKQEMPESFPLLQQPSTSSAAKHGYENISPVAAAAMEQLRQTNSTPF